jgi:repressor LexA
MERRKELGLTQEELARKMGYKSKSTINKIELGRNDIPQSKIAKFAEVLDTTPGRLMGWEKVVKKADTISDVVLRLKTDPEFLSLIETLYPLDAEKIRGVKSMLSAFLK